MAADDMHPGELPRTFFKPSGFKGVRLDHRCRTLEEHPCAKPFTLESGGNFNSGKHCVVCGSLLLVIVATPSLDVHMCTLYTCLMPTGAVALFLAFF